MLPLLWTVPNMPFALQAPPYESQSMSIYLNVGNHTSTRINKNPLCRFVLPWISFEAENLCHSRNKRPDSMHKKLCRASHCKPETVNLAVSELFSECDHFYFVLLPFSGVPLDSRKLHLSCFRNNNDDQLDSTFILPKKQRLLSCWNKKNIVKSQTNIRNT